MPCAHGDDREFIPLGIAVMTVSDTRSLEDDKSGRVLVERIEKAGHRVAAREIVIDDEKLIRDQLQKWLAQDDVGLMAEDRHLRNAVARHRRRGRRQVHLLPARLSRRLQGRLGRTAGEAAGLSPETLQLRGDHAPPGRAPAAEMRRSTPAGIALPDTRFGWPVAGTAADRETRPMACPGVLERFPAAMPSRGIPLPTVQPPLPSPVRRP